MTAADLRAVKRRKNPVILLDSEAIQEETQLKKAWTDLFPSTPEKVFARLIEFDKSRSTWTVCIVKERKSLDGLDFWFPVKDLLKHCTLIAP